jgi:hypothetical protein
MSRFHPNPISRRVYNNNSASYQIDADDREHIQIGSSYRLRVPSKSNRDRRRIEETRRQAEEGSPWAGGFGGIVAGTERLRAGGGGEATEWLGRRGRWVDFIGEGQRSKGRS